MYFKLEIEKQTTIKTLVSNLGEQRLRANSSISKSSDDAVHPQPPSSAG